MLLAILQIGLAVVVLYLCSVLLHVTLRARQSLQQLSSQQAHKSAAPEIPRATTSQISESF